MRNLLHSFLAWFFPMFGHSLNDGGYEVTLIARWYQPTSSSWAMRGIWLSYFFGWQPYVGAEVQEVYVILHFFGHPLVLYAHDLEYREACY